jgi:hypothetical protein
VGPHRVEVRANSPGHVISLLSPDAFLRTEAERFDRELDGSRSYQLLFEYDRR